MILISAGRRVDASDAKEERFPLGNADMVAEALRTRLKALKPVTLVSSAACGSDLIILSEAKRLDIRARIVLPFPPERFRSTSVTDRPGNSSWNWGAIFDELIQQASARNDLIILPDSDIDENAAYAAANQRIIAEAQNLSQAAAEHDLSDADARAIRAMIIWEGSPRGKDDLTAELAKRAEEIGITVEEVKTV